MCAAPEDLAIFDRLYVAFRLGAAGNEPEQPSAASGPPGTLGGGPEPDEIEGVDSPDVLELPLASRVERLAQRDLGELAALDPALLGLLTSTFAKTGEVRSASRYRVAARGRPDRARTLRRMMASGGEMTAIGYVHRQPRARRLVLLVDVSGSMAAYAEALLRFAHAAGRGRRPPTEVFTIGTRLTRVTSMLATADSERAVRDALGAVPDRGGGTRLGRSPQGVPRHVGPARPGSWRDRCRALRRLGARRPRRARTPDGPPQAAGPPGGVGQPAQSATGVRALGRRHGCRAPLTSTTSSKGTAWRPWPTWPPRWWAPLGRGRRTARRAAGG